MSCYGCICNHCLFNVETEPWYFTPGEVQDVEDLCYCCDECKHYDGDYAKRSQWRPECEKHRYPVKYVEQQRRAAEHRAQKRRAAFRIIKKEEQNP